MLIETAEVLWALHQLPSEELPQTATELLTAGYDCQALRVLAGLTSTELADASDLFERVMRELGRPPLPRREAVLRYTRLVSKEILHGEIAPYDGAKRIWNVSIGLDTPLHEVDPFVYAASEYEDRPTDRDFFDSEILKEARRWVDEDGNKKGADIGWETHLRLRKFL
jgi:hypothetical protein